MIAEIFTALMEPLGKAVGSIPKSIRAHIGKGFAALAGIFRRVLVSLLRALVAPFCRSKERKRQIHAAGRGRASN
ncbi:hypothetical protein DES53_108271 [Roseimicrobium gellanilyticum]|uniref:Uncharacterized protein n=1 Tax=Roseimicrobium gellanilyticum TaxID=748857 RepID=A0A366HFW2_9BACT|nr:hypothetical protein DES53_108271 [Roseimicrobium gellanilyticum]